ncbi:MAG: FkbM family methyltransferase [Cytophagales bacterium]
MSVKEKLKFLTRLRSKLYGNSTKGVYDTPFGKMRLNRNKYLDRQIIETGYFEKNSVDCFKRLIGKNEIVLDIGANIGFFTLMFSRLVGDQGVVVAFEPTNRYYSELIFNIELNELRNCTVEKIGLSSSSSEKTIFVGDSSATIHYTNDDIDSRPREIIKLKSLDQYLADSSLSKVDFIKVDIDGHEPEFLVGAMNSIQEYHPKMYLEISQDHYYKAGHNAIDFYDYLKDNGFYVYDENGLIEYPNKREYLLKCANFTFSRNVLISLDRI